MTDERHLQEVDLSTLSPEEIKERLEWRECPGRKVGGGSAIAPHLAPAALPPPGGG